VLVTEAVRSVPRSERRKAIKDAGGLAELGAMLGRLSTLESPSGAASRPGGAWHHAADGSPAAEIAAARSWLEEAQERAPARELAHFSAIEDELDSLDDGAGLPQAFIHPDFVFANVVATDEPGMVVVDWAGAGVGPRAWPLAFLLWAEAVKDPRRAALARAGYRRVVKLTAVEVDRLAGMMRARPLIFGLWRLHAGITNAAAIVAGAMEQRRLTTSLADRIRARFEEEA
jgi:Ser/Thr protein kinase RdoA (MazF antagonist)